MADPVKVELKPGEVVVDQKTLTSVLEGQAKIEKELEDQKLKNVGLEELIKSQAEGGEGKDPRKRKTFTPAFRTVGIKKITLGDNHEKEFFVVGWTNRGAYQTVDASGVSKQIVDYIDVLLLGQERNKDGKLQSYPMPLLSLMNSPEVTCKILEIKDFEGKPYKIKYQPMIDADVGLDREGEDRKYTGEIVRATTWDPKHGLIETGEELEGWVAFTNLNLTIQIPGWKEPVEIDSKFVNI